MSYCSFHLKFKKKGKKNQVYFLFSVVSIVNMLWLVCPENKIIHCNPINENRNTVLFHIYFGNNLKTDTTRLIFLKHTTDVYSMFMMKINLYLTIFADLDFLSL